MSTAVNLEARRIRRLLDEGGKRLAQATAGTEEELYLRAVMDELLDEYATALDAEGTLWRRQDVIAEAVAIVEEGA